MSMILFTSNSDCRRAAQYFITILMVLTVGFMISILPIMNELNFSGKITASKLIWFSTRLVSLILFFQFAVHSLVAIPDNGKAWSFIREIGKPLTILLIVIIAQSLFWQVIDPFVGSRGKTLYVSVAIILILAFTVRLVIKAYQATPYLVETIQTINIRFSKNLIGKNNLCTACGKQVPKSARYCCHCGQNMAHQLKCTQCGVELRENQKFCWQCGHSAVSEDKDSPVISDGESA